jgi:CHAT domain-containing protein
MVHLATHAELNPRNPLFSGIELAPSADRSDSDRRLEVHEILDLRIGSPLVFLSGCETGVGASLATDFVPGEDYATLARAFLYAGARNVIATLWRVEDQGAAEFAARFYRYFPASPPPEALALAQRDMLADARYRAPYYWAGYLVSGEGEVAPGTQNRAGLSVR